jgi:hypothetical protein
MLLTLVIMAKDQATRQVWWGDEAFLSRIHDEDELRDYSRKDFQPGEELYFEESEIFYENPFSSSAFYHRAVKVKGMSSYCESNEADFLKVFLRPEVYNQLQTHFKETEKWKSLDKAYVNFTHFVPIMDGPDSFAFTKDGFFAGCRGTSHIVLKKTFPCPISLFPWRFDFAIPSILTVCHTSLFLSKIVMEMI